MDAVGVGLLTPLALRVGPPLQARETATLELVQMLPGRRETDVPQALFAGGAGRVTNKEPRRRW